MCDTEWAECLNFSSEFSFQKRKQFVGAEVADPETLSWKKSFSSVTERKKKKKMKPPSYNAEEVQQISQEQGERNVAMAVCVQLAGRAIIRVVSRCEEAQERGDLGKKKNY